VRLVRDARIRKPFAGFSLAMTGSAACKIRDERGHFFLAGVVFVARFDSGILKPSRWGRRRSTALQTFAAKDDDETMFLARLDDDFRVADFFYFCREQRDQFFADFRADSSGAAVVTIPFPSASQIGARADVAA